jgi:hypothetical protein
MGETPTWKTKLRDWLLDAIVYRLPLRVLYGAVIRVWALATTRYYTDKSPDQVDIWAALSALQGEINKGKYREPDAKAPL